MKLSTWVQERYTWLWQRQRPILITTVAVPALGLVVIWLIAAINPSSPLRDWLGLWGEKPVTTTVEGVSRDAQGNLIPTKITETTKEEPGKTLWDWLSLLGVPLSLALLAWWLQGQQQKRAEIASREQQKRAEEEAKEEVLQVYFDRISILLIDKNLLGIAAKVYPTKVEDEVQPQEAATVDERELIGAATDVIRARTLSILRRFKDDCERKASVIRFLIETEVVSQLELDLSGADLRGTDLSSANLSNANLRDADLSGADLSGADLSGVDLRGVDLRDADLSGVDLSGVDLRGVDLRDAHLFGTKLCNADLRSANLSGADLSGAQLKGANLSSAHLSGAKLNNIDLGGINLSSADLSSAKLSSVKLRGAYLSNAKLRGADLRSANLSGADLFGADLSDADLSNADLSNVYLSVADLRGVRANDTTIWPTPAEVAKANNIPDELKKQLGLT
ncbi:MAG TPA: pentapeptide repeat-containing protein [Leptolyngbyaceae cyanobacterium]